MSRKDIDDTESKMIINLLKVGHCQECDGLIREQIKKSDDIDNLLFERDHRGKLIGIMCPECAKYVKQMTRERYL